MSKRFNEDDLHANYKNIRVQAENEIERTQPQQTTIFDLGDRFIEEVISYLEGSIDDLLNVAEADHRLATFATKVYSRMEGNFFNLSYKTNEQSLRIIRYFGHVLRSILLNADLFDYDVHIINEMKIRCRQSLLQLYINIYGYASDNIPGKRYWCQFLQSSGQTFTNLSKFTFHFARVDEIRDIGQIIQHFPNLLFLEASVNDTESLQRLILLNRRLMGLTLRLHGQRLTPDFVHILITSLRDIRRISLENVEVFNEDFNVIAPPNQRFIFNNLLFLTFKPLNCNEINLFNVFPIPLNNFLNLSYVCKSKVTDSYINTVCQNQNLRNLIIGNISNEQLLKLAHSLQHLQEFHVYSSVLTPSAISTFLNSCPRLYRMAIDDPAANNLQNGLIDILADTIWRMELYGNRLIFLKRAR